MMRLMLWMAELVCRVAKTRWPVSAEVMALRKRQAKNLCCLLMLANGTPIGFEESYRLCGQCHGTIFRDWREGIHGRREGYWNGAKSYQLCAHCHNPHAPAFEPIDAYKGDFARSYFYMSVRYYTEDASWPSSEMTRRPSTSSAARAAGQCYSAGREGGSTVSGTGTGSPSRRARARPSRRSHPAARPARGVLASSPSLGSMT